MHRFFVDPSTITDHVVALSEDDTQHALRVLRLHEGDTVLICDGKDRECSGKIIGTTKKSVSVQLEDFYELHAEPQMKITLYQGFPKADKNDTIFQKGTEVGISGFVPFISERSVVKTDSKNKMRRYERIIYEASKQSHRGMIPSVEEAISFQEVCQRIPFHEMTLVAWEEEAIRSVKEALCGFRGTDIAIVIGPEGGLSSEEVASMEEAGAITVTLGPRILRTETAGTALAVMILYEFGNMT